MTVRTEKPQGKKKKNERGRLEKSNKSLGRDNNKMMQTGLRQNTLVYYTDLPYLCYGTDKEAQPSRGEGMTMPTIGKA